MRPSGHEKLQGSNHNVVVLWQLPDVHPGVSASSLATGISAIFALLLLLSPLKTELETARWECRGKIHVRKRPFFLRESSNTVVS